MGRRRNVYRTNGDSWKVGQFGFALTVIGLEAVSLAVASVRHHQDVRHLRTAYGPVPRSNAVVIAQLVSWVWAVGWCSSRGIAGIEAAPRAVCTWLLARLLQQGTLASLRRLSRTRMGHPHAMLEDMEDATARLSNNGLAGFVIAIVRGLLAVWLAP